MLAPGPRVAKAAEARQVAKLLASMLATPGAAEALRAAKALALTFIDLLTTKSNLLAVPRPYVALRASVCLAVGAPLKPASRLRPAKAAKA